MKTAKELGEIGAKAANIIVEDQKKKVLRRYGDHDVAVNPNRSDYDLHQPAREAFAAAVAAAVRAETPWGEAGETLEVWLNKQCEAKYKQMLAEKEEWLAGCEKGDAEVFAKQSNTELASGIESIRLHVGSAFHGILNAAVLRLRSSGSESPTFAMISEKAAELEAVAAKLSVERSHSESLSAIIEKAIEMVNMPGTTPETLPQAINAKIVERDGWHNVTIKRADAAESEIARLKSEYSSLLQVYKTTDESERQARKALAEAKAEFAQAIVAEQAKKHEALAEVTTLRARLAALEWRPVSVKPTREDADAAGFVSATDGQGFAIGLLPWNDDCVSNYAYWRPFSPPPVPSREELERAEFESWAKGKEQFSLHRSEDTQGRDYFSSATQNAWISWQAARSSKEGKA